MAKLSIKAEQERTFMSNRETLLKSSAYIDGQWTNARSAEVLEVHNPATGVLVGTVPDMNELDTRIAIEAASRALPAWSALAAKERALHLKAWARLINANIDALAQILTAEQGKQLLDARNEVNFAES